MKDLIWNFLSLVFGTGLGAFLAFGFERRQRRREERDDHYLAAKYAHFVLLQQYSLLRNLAAQHLTCLAENNQRWWMLHPIQSPPQSFSIDSNALSFILRSQDPDLLNRLAVAQDRFSTLMRLLDQRSGLHAQFQDRLGVLHREGSLQGDTFTLDEDTQTKIGRPLLAQLRQTTDFLFEGVPSDQAFIKARLKELEDFIRKEFPKERPPRYHDLPISGGDVAEPDDEAAAHQPDAKPGDLQDK